MKKEEGGRLNELRALSRIKKICVLVLFLLPAALCARDIEIYVEDEELGLPLEGAVVALRNGRQYVCGEDGVASFSIVDERQQVVQITYPGYDTRRVTIPAGTDGDRVLRIIAAMQLSGVMQGRELVVEAQRPEVSETKSGRSVAISERELAQTAEIGLIEDVMSSVKLLPGVGYTGMFGAMPSIRGGDPGDLMASFDGFYLERPYHWVGAVSIFDPKMVSSARLSHGVFSSRYGHTVSGLLEIASKSPSATEVELETSISTSAVSFNLSYPLGGRGGVLFMGKVSYWDVYLGFLKGLSQVTDDENLDMINAVSVAPYIRSAAVAVDYNFAPNLDWRLNAFFGSDGVGAASTVEYDGDDLNEGVDGSVRFDAVYDNYQGFLISGINASPSPVLAIKAAGGFGFIKTVTDDSVNNSVTVNYNPDFLYKYSELFELVGQKKKDNFTSPDMDMEAGADHTILNVQARGDLDWDLGKGFIAAFGVQELYSYWMQDQHFNMTAEFKLAELDQSYFAQLPPEMAYVLNTPQFQYIKNIPGLAVMLPMSFDSELRTQGFTTSAYSLLEYTSPNNRIGAELGLRVDHLYLLGKNFTAQTQPALNPRFNIDFNIFKNKGIVDSLDVTLGTGLFSSINNLVSFIDKDRVNIDGDLKFNRAWTSIAGVKLDFEHGFIFNIEGYYKYIFDRAYIDADIFSSPEIKADFHFDGIGHVGGFDLQLQKLESRYVDGWVSYTFTWANYQDPHAGGEGVNQGSINGAAGWYYPSFHRFHNCNLVLNVKPVDRINIAARFGFASGQLRERTLYEKDINPYPVIFVKENENGIPIPEIHQKYERETQKDADGNTVTVKERMPWSLPLDVKFSFFIFNRKGRVTTEIYLAGENLLWFYRPQIEGNTRFNDYTGKEDDTGSSSGGGLFDFPVPMISFGFKWKY